MWKQGVALLSYIKCTKFKNLNYCISRVKTCKYVVLNVETVIKI